MKMKTIVVLAFAVGCGLIAMMGVQQMIADKSNPEDSLPVKVLVASIDIPPGVLVTEVNTEFKEYPAHIVPEDAIRTKEEYHDRGLLVPVTAGDVIRMSKLGGRGEIAASASIPDGMRAFSISVNDTKTHSGLLQPGDRVDLQISYSVRSNNGLLVSKSETLLEYIEVFASDSIRNLEAGESKEIKAKNITFLVTPEQSKLIQLANGKGEIIPIIRSKDDDTITQTESSRTALMHELKTGVLYEDDRFEEPTEEEKVAETEPKQSAAQAFKNFLSDSMKQAEARKAAEAEKLAEKKAAEEAPEEMWEIQIFAGEQVITQKVALPVSANRKNTPEILLPMPSNEDSPKFEHVEQLLMAPEVQEPKKSAQSAAKSTTSTFADLWKHFVDRAPQLKSGEEVESADGGPALNEEETSRELVPAE